MISIYGADGIDEKMPWCYRTSEFKPNSGTHQNLSQILGRTKIQAKFWDAPTEFEPKFEHLLSVNRGHSSAEGQNLDFHSQTVGK